MTWQAQLPPTHLLLREGGDERLAICSPNGTDKYGCQSTPTPVYAEFGSSTATSISSYAYAAADSRRQGLIDARATAHPSHLYERGLQQIRQDLLALCDLADMEGLDTIFAASGTDLHLIGMQLMANRSDRLPLVIMMDGTETGSGVPHALQGRHFARQTALGCATPLGGVVSLGAQQEVVQMATRLPDGQPRPLQDIHVSLAALVEGAVRAGRHVLMVSLDVSKTGLQVPSPAFLKDLKTRWGDSLNVLVDACQFRISNLTLRAYLEHGFMVAMTGSKFLTGPSFCGALFIPAELSTRLCRQPLPMGLHHYCAKSEWPAHWQARADLVDKTNFGLLLRWTACLAELKVFRQIPDAHVRHFLKVFALTVNRRLSQSCALEPLPVHALARCAEHASRSWDHIQTIFPFVLHRSLSSSHRIPLTPGQTRHVYRALQTGKDARIQLGQPVTCGQGQAGAVSALRLCASTRLIVEATTDGGRRAQAVVQRAFVALDRTEELVNTHRQFELPETVHAGFNG